MYTLEDDQETSARLRKRNFASNTSDAGTFSAEFDQQGTSGTSSAQDNGDRKGGRSKRRPYMAQDNGDRKGRPYMLQFGSSFVSRLSPRPIIYKLAPNSFKKLTTPTKANANGKRVALAALTIACIGVFFTALDQTVVVTALPQIITDIQVPITKLDHAAWIISGYLLGFIIAMPLMGRVSDIYGRRRIFLLCLSIFGIGSVFCGLSPILAQISDLSFLSILHIDTSSPGLIWLVGARFFQAIGGGALVPVAMAIAGDFYGEERRGLALGIIGAVTEAGGVLGPLYGALIVQHFGWQFIFYFNAPIVLCLFVAAWIFIPKGTHSHEGIDWIGAILLGLTLTCLSLGLAQQGTDLGPTTVNGSTPQNNPISLLLAAVFLIAFILYERKARWPVVDLSLFKRFPFSASSLVSLFVGAALIIAMADIPIYIDTVLQRPVLDSGLALLRMTALIPVGALLGGWLCSRISCRFTGVLGLLFTSVGFYLMSRWPINVNWNQITISAVTAGLGFGLVIAPIGTTAINAVKARQAGMGSAVVTALRMVGMMLGLAALTSWGLAYFKQLASKYPSLPVTATADQFAQWSQGYAQHLIESAHTVYSAIFLVSMVICLIAIIPAIFLWRRQPVEEEENVGVQSIASNENQANIGTQSFAPDKNEQNIGGQSLVPDENQASTDESATPQEDIAATPTGPIVGAASLATTAVVNENSLADAPPVPPTIDESGNGDNGGRSPRNRRRLIIAIISVGAVVLLILAGVFAALTWQSPGANGTTASTGIGNSPGNPTATPTPIAGPRRFQLALDEGALTSLFVSQLGLQQGTLTDFQVVPVVNDGLIISLNLHIDAKGIHRVMPIEIDSTLGIDKQQNIQLHILRLSRDGLDAGPTAAANMEQGLNELLINSIMPSLRGQLKGVKFISVHTSASLGCSRGAEMLVLLIEAPPIQGIAAQPTPTTFCFKGPIDLNKLLPH